MESDESTNNFDPEFTSADIREVGVPDILDDDDPSEAWVSQSFGANVGHTPNGPLGSERTKSPTISYPLNSITNGKSQGIQIKRQNRKKDLATSPLTSSVQENFRGFTYHGGESVIPSMLTSLRKEEKNRNDEAVEDEDAPAVTTDDEAEDFTKSAGRYARRQGQPYYDDMS